VVDPSGAPSAADSFLGSRNSALYLRSNSTEFPRTPDIGSPISEKTPSRQLVNRSSPSPTASCTDTGPYSTIEPALNSSKNRKESSVLVGVPFSLICGYDYCSKAYKGCGVLGRGKESHTEE
jgi:hypothetical protein